MILILAQLTQALLMTEMVSCGKRDVALTYYTTDIMVFQIYTKRYAQLGKGAIVQGKALYYTKPYTIKSCIYILSTTITHTHYIICSYTVVHTAHNILTNSTTLTCCQSFCSLDALLSHFLLYFKNKACTADKSTAVTTILMIGTSCYW